MNPIIVLELVLRIWLRILEATPDTVIAEQQKMMLEDLKWWRKFLKIDE